jgi:hypothetical protein
MSLRKADQLSEREDGGVAREDRRDGVDGSEKLHVGWDFSRDGSDVNSDPEVDEEKFSKCYAAATKMYSVASIDGALRANGVVRLVFERDATNE